MGIFHQFDPFNIAAKQLYLFNSNFIILDVVFQVGIVDGRILYSDILHYFLLDIRIKLELLQLIDLTFFIKALVNYSGSYFQIYQTQFYILDIHLQLSQFFCGGVKQLIPIFQDRYFVQPILQVLARGLIFIRYLQVFQFIYGLDLHLLQFKWFQRKQLYRPLDPKKMPIQYIYKIKKQICQNFIHFNNQSEVQLKIQHQLMNTTIEQQQQMQQQYPYQKFLFDVYQIFGQTYYLLIGFNKTLETLQMKQFKRDEILKQKLEQISNLKCCYQRYINIKFDQKHELTNCQNHQLFRENRFKNRFYIAQAIREGLL